MTYPPSTVQTRAENAEARERYLEANLIRSQQALLESQSRVTTLEQELAAKDKELEKYKQAEIGRQNERKKVEEDGKQLFEAQMGRLKAMKAAGGSLSEQAHAFCGDMPPELSIQEQAVVWIAKLEAESKK